MSRTHLFRQHSVCRTVLCIALSALCVGAAWGAEGRVGEIVLHDGVGRNSADGGSGFGKALGLVVAQADSAQSAFEPESRASARERTTEELDAAKARSAAADAAYSRMKRSNRPRGSAKAEIVKERMEASEALAAAQAAYDKVHPYGR
jgi:hypothetical protein